MAVEIAHGLRTDAAESLSSESPRLVLLKVLDQK